MPSEQPAPIYLLPGMTRDYPVFSKLAPLLPGAKLISYADPHPRESIVAYAARMADDFPGDCFLAGVSFGGIVAQELAKVIQPRGCIVIASVKHPRELPPWFRLFRLLGSRNCERMLGTTGALASAFPARFRKRSVLRLTKLSGPAGAWHRWATAAVLDWKPDVRACSTPLLHIHGDADTTFPIRYTRPDVTIHGGQHALPISHPRETADTITRFTRHQ